ncbi:glycoside hydrolase family 2 protein [Maribellus sediminis]|uniref:glycoside hydrolase family 2 protein n=1 Tax=Maribellus sediminis TaxID=2696285 RepID=UPI00142FF53B|nr:glycoside hydrolase family 2 TIM barrel-domain containing protein [Maribellus sediminis]
MQTKLSFFIIFSTLFWDCSQLAEFKRIEIEGVQNPVILLNGTWKFTMDPPEEFWKESIDFQSWADIRVPGECQMQGFAIKHDTPYVYKTKFQIPEDYNGKQIGLNFHGVYSYARVWVNGHFIREHYGGFTKWTCDISDFVEAGETAVLTVEFADLTDDISYGSGYAKHQIGGILRDVELTALPKQNFKKLYFESDLDENYEHAVLKVFYELEEYSTSELKIQLISAENKVIKSVKKQTDGQAGVIEIPVENPKKWDAEHPNLYTAVVSLIHDGKEILKTVDKIGFREVVVDGNRLLVNGIPVKLRGACRHDIHPELGRMTTSDYDLKDVMLAKECNMNFIRTSHYPPSEHFLRYCDEYGIYVEDETAVCFVGSHRTEVYRESGASESDPDFTARYLSQLEEMVENHRNHPSIIIWSIGNENHFGSNFVESYNWVKENDLTRPVIYSYPGQVPDSLEIYDIVSMHYPDWRGNLNQYGVATVGFESSEKPMLFDEWAHVACYNNFELKEDPNVRNFWGQSLDSMWTNLFETEGGLGGAIWCMIDETFMLPDDLDGFNEWWGILDKNIIPATYEGPCVGYGEWGIIDTWRRKKPEFWATKKAYSPTKIYSKQINDFEPGKELKIPVHNRFDHTNFSELKIKWKYGAQSGVLAETNIEPHHKGILVFPPNSWNPEEKLNIQFFQNDTFLVDEYNLQIGEKTVKLPTLKHGNLRIVDSGELKLITGKNYTLEVNTKSGLFQNVKVDGDLLLKSGPHLNLRIPGESVQYSTIKMDDLAKSWECEKFSFSEEDGVATITVKGKYDNSIDFSYRVKMDESGVLVINYSAGNLEKDRNIQEAGIKFMAGNEFNNLTWQVNSYFTAYPEASMGSPEGEVSLLEKPPMVYRQKPQHSWEMDSKGFYYFGLENELPYTNIVRGLKENCFSYALKTNTSALTVLSNGTQACRFDKIEGKNTLIVNDLWDYNSLMWGNYYKQIKSGSAIEGQVNLVFE